MATGQGKAAGVGAGLDDTVIARHASAICARSLCQHCLLRIIGLWLALPFLIMSLMALGL